MRSRVALLGSACVIVAACAGDRGGGCAPGLPEPRDVAALPLGRFAPDPDGPGYGAELVFSRHASLASGHLLHLTPPEDAEAFAVVRWLGVTPALVDDVRLAVPPPAGVELATAPASAKEFPKTEEALPDLSTFEEDGTLLLAVRTKATATVDVELSFTAVTALPAWEAGESAPVGGVAEPSGVDWDPVRDELIVVSDDGAVARIAAGDFSQVYTEQESGDLEAVRWVPGLDLWLVLDEAASRVLAFGESESHVLTVVLASGLDPAPVAGGDGFEGLAVTGVSGRTVELLLANQNDPHCLYRGTATIPFADGAGADLVLTSAHPQPALNLGEVTFDWGSRQVLTLHGYVAQGPTLRLLDASLSTVLDEAQLPAVIGAEGFTFHRAGAFVADDLGSVRRLDVVP